MFMQRFCRTGLLLGTLLWAASAFAVNNLDIQIVDLSEFPRVNLTVTADAADLPLSAFSATDNAISQTLLASCFESRQRPVDIVFCIDISLSMENDIREATDEIANFVAALEIARPGIELRYGLITYGQASDPNAAQACPSSTGLYYGGPRNRTISGLVDTDGIIAALTALACPGQNPPNCLRGGNEPAYHAINCAANSTPWRVNSEKKIVLISDENNDWAAGAGAGCINDPIPFYSLAAINASLDALSIRFFAWCNDVVVCDGHDNGDGIAPENHPCIGVLQPDGCVSGYTDFFPIADHTSGAAVLLTQPASELFAEITFDLLTTYTLCYDLPCCVPGVLHTIQVTATNGGGSASDNATYTPGVDDCPPNQNPVIYCDPLNPAGFVPGDPITLCFVATDPDGIDHVAVTVAVGSCSYTVNATPAGGNRYCVTIAAACTDGALSLYISGTAYDICGNHSSVECILPPIVTGCFDLGDLPAPYPTHGIETGGPSHHIVTGEEVAWLGTGVDCEPGCCDDGGGEDNGFTPDCAQQGRWADCNMIDIPVTVSVGMGYSGQTLYLSAWYDYNGNGSFEDLYICFGDIAYPEWIIRDEVVTPGVNTFTVPVANATAGYINLRFRLSTVPFGAHGYEGNAPDGEVEDYSFYCPPTSECCRWCVAVPALGFDAQEAIGEHPNLNLVMYLQDGRIRLAWNALPGAAYYQVYRGNAEDALTTMNLVATVPGIDHSYQEPATLNNLPPTAVYVVQPYLLTPKVLCDEADRGRWEFNEGAGPTTEDFSGNGFDATRWAPCPPAWGYEEIENCNIGYSHFEGVHPDGCPEHFRAANDDIWYHDLFQVWACVRLASEPTFSSGPYYIVSNSSFDVLGGGFSLRVDPGYDAVTGTWHNRLTVFVWNADANGGTGGWNTLQSPAPTLPDLGRYSVPVGVWSTVCAVVNGNSSMLIIDGQVVAVGPLHYRSENNGAPLVIGAGYRHSTYPIEYPWYGDIDCLRITTLCER